eukprot:TRINITY_DN7349_c0_g2_i3.p1 TRINITY_DN7349_c0_g2~~TRINITY_DN7349_c0_g2_i3.p1  ORF type:complete len:674 (+),score=140.73 TRINITY_DN7349_c0_g2_i3:418-2439(+)
MNRLKQKRATERENKVRTRARLMETRQLIVQSQEYFSIIGKAVASVKNEKFLTTIRIMEELRKRPIASLKTRRFTNNFEAVIDKVVPYLNQRIIKKLEEMGNDFAIYLKMREKELGHALLMQVKESIKSQQASRASSIQRRDSIRKAPRESLVRLTSIDEPQTNIVAVTRNFNPIDFQPLMQIAKIYASKGDFGKFIELLKQSRRKILVNLALFEPTGVSSFTILLAEVVGFFLVQSQLESKFNLSTMDVLWKETLEILAPLTDRAFEVLERTNEFIEMKEEMRIFQWVLQKLGFAGQALALNDNLRRNFLRFAEKMTTDYLATVREDIFQDDFQHFVITSQEEMKKFTVKFQFTLPSSTELLSKKNQANFASVVLPFTRVVPNIVGIIENFVINAAEFMRGILDQNNLIFIQLDRFLYELTKLFSDFLYTPPGPNVLQLAQTMQNINYLQMSLSYFVTFLEGQTRTSFNRSLNSSKYFDELKVGAEEKIYDALKAKLSYFLSFYDEISWEPHVFRRGHHDFAEDLCDYLQGVFSTMRLISEDLIISLLYLALKYISEGIFGALSRAKTYNIIALAALDADIWFIYNSFVSYYRDGETALECFREIRQFLHLFLKGHVHDLIDESATRMRYAALSIPKLIPILDRYRKIVVPELPTVRKREVQAVIKRLKGGR